MIKNFKKQATRIGLQQKTIPICMLSTDRKVQARLHKKKNKPKLTQTEAYIIRELTVLCIDRKNMMLFVNFTNDGAVCVRLGLFGLVVYKPRLISNEELLS